jgi:hypothetical protein
MSRHYDVVIATPGNLLDHHYVWSLTQTIKYLELNNITWLWASDYSSHVGEARQRVLDQISGVSYNKLFWIDSDIYWDVEDFMKLYSSDLDIVSGCYLTTAGVAAAQNLEGYSLPPEDILAGAKNIELQSCGFGFLCMKRGIIESLAYPFHPVNDILNEDVAFCLRARNELNLSIWLDTSVRVEHFKIMSLNWENL